ncbi:hypothetical protein ACF058_26715 [Streptomyces sp. NPDC015501]|uniref:hypothetical protein n=1 Tax=unclassified Streptomyces TaxID=2593676 RepID=UPI00126D51C4|nr:hypothetical protein A3L22_26735 [Streptomyces griseus subsp. griseus]
MPCLDASSGSRLPARYELARPDLFGGCHDRFETEVLELLERYSERVGLVQDEMSTVLPARRPEGKA